MKMYSFSFSYCAFLACKTSLWLSWLVICLRGLVATCLLPGMLVIYVITAGYVWADYKNLALTGVNLSARVLLQGAYQSDTGLMRDDLQTGGLLPLAQPYSAAPFEYNGTEVATPEILAQPGQDAAVDWVLLELRETAAPFALLAQRAAILQRDGDVVEPDTGAVVLNFADVVTGDYRVSIRHRNHSGVLTAAALPLSTDVTLIDFSNPQVDVIGDESRVRAGAFSLLWAGDVNQDQRIIANGTGNDRNFLLADILQAAGNSGFNLSYIHSGYQAGDFNFDGKLIYIGPGNDSILLISNILSHPENLLFANNYIINNQFSLLK